MPAMDLSKSSTPEHGNAPNPASHEETVNDVYEDPVPGNPTETKEDTGTDANEVQVEANPSSSNADSPNPAPDEDTVNEPDEEPVQGNLTETTSQTLPETAVCLEQEVTGKDPGEEGNPTQTTSQKTPTVEKSHVGSMIPSGKEPSGNTPSPPIPPLEPRISAIPQAVPTPVPPIPANQLQPHTCSTSTRVESQVPSTPIPNPSLTNSQPNHTWRPRSTPSRVESQVPSTPIPNSAPTNSQPDYPKPFPDSLEEVLSEIETVAKHSTIPVAQPESEFHEFFWHSFLPKEPYQDHELWDQVDDYLNARIGADVLPRTLHQGRYGIDGLFRHWLVRVRAFRGWDDHCDEAVEAKLRGVVTLLKRKVKPPQLAPLGPQLVKQSTSAQQSGSQATSTRIPIKRCIDADSQVTTPPKRTKVSPSPGNSEDDADPGPSGSSSRELMTNQGHQDQVPDSVQKAAPTGLWMMAQSPLFDVTLASIGANKLLPQDVPQVYRAMINLLLRRKEGIDVPAKPPIQEAEPFGVKNKLSVRAWLSRNPNSFLVRSAGEAPWHRHDIFNFTLPNYELPTTPDDKVQTTYVHEILSLFYSPGTKRINQAVRMIVAAVTFARMDTNELPVDYTPPEVEYPNQDIGQCLQAAHHFKNLHETKQQTQCAAECMEVMTGMVNRLYTVFEAVASLRAKFHHALYLS
ncbi:uncharacterized protein MELLADRAFT_85357 [Melampsora larici-populina 98AG31]|uniref:Uncharacterized protein n=1 Tax=Melampsora larici-populina (strain 98AG31 / pathotype 3-4-7) TaxID=747676 RepID=F4SD39_MELLP|nr:uncharacterized protein MELLADRAFT_85357 [Melampsora larici-populina 98AG31]EGF97433.1 hypothetical protein MELLADRAFT_85357 [Melampsora larici-populina 98AG31]